ncbi:hypothetical protein ACOSQ4_012356 [Xanthoceras sorbifolium]
MADKDLAELCHSLSLEDGDEPITTLDSHLKEAGSKQLGFCLAGKLILNKMVNWEAFRAIIPKIWRIRQGVEVEVIRANTFIFQLKNIMDCNMVLKGGLWSFDNALLVLEVPIGSGSVAQMCFSTAEFWVQLHNVPLLCMTKEIGHFLGKQIGEVLEVDSGTLGGYLGKYLRTRVRIDICKPLKRFLRVDTLGNGVETIMPLKYERLPEY